MSAPVTHYAGSRGPMEIAAMPYPYLANAHAKLTRERLDDSRDGEIATMAARLAELDAEAEAEQAVTGGGDTLSGVTL